MISRGERPEVEKALPNAMSVMSQSEAQERIWIEASKKGDNVAFNRLVLKWEPRIYNLSLRMLNNSDEAAETTQEVFLSVFRNIRGFKHKSKFSTWIFRIAVNHSISRLRKRPPLHQPMDEFGIPTDKSSKHASSGNQEKQLWREERRRKILDSIALLGEHQRAIVELKFYQDETFEEISTALEIPLSTVKSRFYAALDILKHRLSYLAEELNE
jgi:RNA polymerase sigma-70 factor (ECF subfamily)